MLQLLTMDQTQPAAGVWRNARMEEIRSEEHQEVDVWLIQYEAVEGVETRAAVYIMTTNKFLWKGGSCYWAQVIRYARINT